MQPSVCPRTDRALATAPAAVWLPVVLVLVLPAGCSRQDHAPPSPLAPRTDRTDKAGEPKTAPQAEPARAEHTPETSYAALSDAERQRARELYNRHCGGCHGENGDGAGLAARFMYPKPRDFRRGLFRLVSTTNGVPTRDDLDVVLRRGMPGSAMPPWPALSESDRRLLAEQVIEFRREGIRQQEIQLAREFGEEPDFAEINKLVAGLTRPGPAIDVPEISKSSLEAVARGKELYLQQGCAGCHGKEGRGDGQEKMVDAEGYPTRPRDLTRGIFKGSPDPVSVYIRTQAGMPGTPMPAAKKLTHEQISDLVHFVLSLSDEKTRQANVLNRERIEARAIDQIPEAPDDPRWAEVGPVHVRLTPLWWRDDFAGEIEVQAVHDKDKLALRLSWNDATHNDSAVQPDEFDDMVAVELCPPGSEPFLGMGLADTRVDVWHWRAGLASTGAEDQLLDEYPFDTAEYRERAEGRPLPDFLTARAAHNPLAIREHSGANLVAQGPGTLTFRPPVSQAVQADGAWSDGRWSVVLVRRLELAAEDGLPLAAGGTCAVALAVWDGAARDRAGQKLISIWNDLKLE